MKHIKNKIMIAAILTLCTGLTELSLTPVANITNIAKIDTNFEVEIKAEVLDLKSTNDFLNNIGFRESGNRYDIVNKFGYMGKYQFGKKTLKSLGINVSEQDFLSNPQLQEEAMLMLLRSNRKILKKYILQNNQKSVNGIYITESGILAAAHLAGAGNVKKFFKTGKDFEDGLGTKLTSYMQEFSGYYLNF